MRHGICRALLRHAAAPDFLFLTGDLGFQALEPLRDAAGARFINAGVAEQNMVSVAAGAARAGFKPWAYSIAPFIYGRPFEQIRNDVCLHDLPVRLVGNGGGFAYGVMGPTHHALEDYGALLCLPHIRVFIPAFADDVPSIVDQLMPDAHPAYVRLGRCEKPKDIPSPAYAPWRRLARGQGPALLAVGPLAGGLLAAVRELSEALRPNLWVLAELPIAAEAIPREFLEDMRGSGHLCVVEEHVAHAGVGESLARLLLLSGQAPARFTHRCAAGYLSGLYGSQEFHRRECGLDAGSILAGLRG